VKVEWPSKWKVELSSRVGGGAVGVHAVQPARMLPRSSAIPSSGFRAGTLLFLAAGREAFLAGRCESGPSFSLYEALTGVDAIRAETREGGRLGSSLRFLTCGRLEMSGVVAGGL